MKKSLEQRIQRAAQQRTKERIEAAWQHFARLLEAGDYQEAAALVQACPSLAYHILPTQLFDYAQQVSIVSPESGALLFYRALDAYQPLFLLDEEMTLQRIRDSLQGKVPRE